MRSLALVALLLGAVAPPAHADPAEPPALDLAKIRELYARRDYEGVRREVRAAYARDPDPALLFALGQVELHLGNYAAAIAYYERFIASGPSEEQIALAQQAIGAARMRRAQPRRDEPRALRRRGRWTVEDSGLAALGGAAAIVGVGFVIYAGRLGDDRSGTLADYDARVARAHTTRWTGVAIGGAGVLLAGVTVLRWRLRTETVVVTAHASADGGGLVLGGTW